MRRVNRLSLGWRAKPPACFALALVLAGCFGDRPEPIGEDLLWIQTSTDHVAFVQNAYQPETVEPEIAPVRVATGGEAEPSSVLETSISYDRGDDWLVAEMGADPSGQVLYIRPQKTRSFSPGTYTANVSLDWDGAANSPKRIRVTFSVGPYPRLWSPGLPSAAGRIDHTTTALGDGGALVVGGRLAPSSIERFFPATGEWLPASTLERGRYLHTATLLGTGEVFIAGGYSGSLGGGGVETVGTWEIYDPVEGRVTYTGTLMFPRAGHAAVRLHDGRVLLVGGMGSDASLSAARFTEMFDRSSLITYGTGELHGDSVPFTPAVLLPDGHVLVTNSNPEHAYTGAELFDPSTEMWTVLANRPTPRLFHGLVALRDGRVLAMGSGPVEGTPEDRLIVEMYDPTTGQWSLVAPLLVEQTVLRDAAVLLPSGRVLVAGGVGVAPMDTSAAQIFDPSGETWSLTDALVFPRSNHTVTVLADDRVLAVGGPIEARPEFWREPSP